MKAVILQLQGNLDLKLAHQSDCRLHGGGSKKESDEL